MEINNYGSIRKLSIPLFTNQNKIELLFGLSGSGKSTIVDALMGKEKTSLIFDGDSNITIISDIINSRKLDGNFSYFNEESSIEIKENKYNCFDLLSFNNGESIEVSLEIIRGKVDEINNWKIENADLLETHATIAKTLYKTPITTTIPRINNQVSEINVRLPEEHRGGLQSGLNLISWLNEGGVIHENKNVCLFCEGKVTTERIAEVDEIIRSTFTDAQFKKLVKILQLEDLPFPRENLYVDEALLRQVNNSKLYSDLKERIELIVVLDFKTLVLTNNLENYKFADSFSQIDTIFSTYNEIIDKTVQENNNNRNFLNNIIQTNKTEINKFLELIQFQYRIDFNVESGSKDAKYILKHVANMNSTIENSHILSYGEKNLLSLIITLAGAQNKQLLILDDPMSSFDDMKRKVIIKKIMQYKEERSLEILILTHDEYFVKQVLFEDSVASKYKVRLLYRCNNNELKVQPIKQRNFINALSYSNINEEFPIFLKLILLRQIIEIKRSNSSDVIYRSLYVKISNLIKLQNEEIIGNLSEYLAEGLSDDELIHEINRHFNITIADTILDINLDDFDALSPVNTLLVTRFLVVSKKYKYRNEQYDYFMNELVHLFTSPIKQFDENTMSNILNLETFKVSEELLQI